jgi:hypothetical protein
MVMAARRYEKSGHVSLTIAHYQLMKTEYPVTATESIFTEMSTESPQVLSGSATTMVIRAKLHRVLVGKAGIHAGRE